MESGLRCCLFRDLAELSVGFLRLFFLSMLLEDRLSFLYPLLFIDVYL